MCIYGHTIHIQKLSIRYYTICRGFEIGSFTSSQTSVSEVNLYFDTESKKSEQGIILMK